ncbi:MAG: hypothetical protein HYT10_02750 [Candidatus Levybacteria bacterium]|nr:hypothetical protein [Candidatus Levybacteria bacterium]
MEKQPRPIQYKPRSAPPDQLLEHRAALQNAQWKMATMDQKPSQQPRPILDKTQTPTATTIVEFATS